MQIFDQDYEFISGDKNIPFEELRGKTILITGGTGLIGSTLIRALLYCSEKSALPMTVLVLARDVDKAKKMLISKESDLETVKFLHGDVENIPEFDGDVDYVIHGAYPTASSYFSAHPVGTIKTGIFGTLNLLELAKAKNAKRFLFLSSMEVYGEVHDDTLLTEGDLGQVNLYSTRSCYPESKRMCENLCTCFAAEYGLSTSSLRLAQTFGPGVSVEDKRVFAMMARCAINKNDIVLNTPGASKHPYLYTAQAVTAILTVLLKGESGKAYNAANPDTYCSIYDMGVMVAREIANGEISVLIRQTDSSALYPPTSYLNLDVSEIKKLGWTHYGDLAYIFKRMISVMLDEMGEKDPQ